MASRFDTPVQFNPYIQQLPAELASQVGMYLTKRYEDGLQRAQASLDQVANLDIIKPQDKILLQEKLSGISQAVARLTREDFSNPVVSGKINQLAASVYADPLIQNAVLGTKMYRAKKEQIDNIRTQKQELYNSDNAAYAMADVQQWLNDGQTGSRLMDNRQYDNFYDVSAEIRTLMKDFKPASARKKLPNGQWIITEEDKSWTSDQLKNYLHSALSEQGKKQLKIHAFARFSGNDELLYQSYVASLKKNLSANESRIKAIGVKSIVNPDQKKELETELLLLQDQNADIKHNLEHFTDGGQDYFNANKENMASYLYRTAYIDQIAKGYSHPDITTEYSPNAIWQTTHVQNAENARLSARLAFEAEQKAADRAQQMDLKQVELGLKYFDKNGKLKSKADTEFIKAQPNVSEGSRVTTGQAEFENHYKDLNQQNTQNYELLKQKLLAQSSDLNSRYLDYVRQGGKESDKHNPLNIAATEYLKNQLSKPAAQRDIWASEYLEESNRIITQRKVFDQLKTEIENKISLQYGKELEEVEKQYRQLGNVTIPLWDIRRYNGYNPKSGDVSVKLTTSQLKDLYFNTQGTPVWKGGDYIRPGGGVTGRNKLEYRINGIEGRVGDRFGWEKSNPDLALFLNIVKKNESLQHNVANYRNKLYEQAVLNLGDYWTPVSSKDPAITQAINYVQRQGGGDTDEYNVSFVNRSTGEVQFKINPRKDSKTNPEMLKSLGYTYNAANDTYSTTSLSGLFKRDMEDLTPTEKVLISGLDGNINVPQVGYYTPAATWDPSGNGQFMQIVKDLSKTGAPRYFLRHENSGTLIDIDLKDPVSAVHAAKKLTQDTKMLQDIIRKKNPNYNITP